MVLYYTISYIIQYYIIQYYTLLYKIMEHCKLRQCFYISILYNGIYIDIYIYIYKQSQSFSNFLGSVTPGPFDEYRNRYRCIYTDTCHRATLERETDGGRRSQDTPLWGYGDQHMRCDACVIDP